MTSFTNNPSFPVGLKVLAVDHDIGALCTIRDICNGLCYQVITCCTISDARNYLFNQNFDIILIEANMPSNDTFDFVGQITSHFPVIMMSHDPTPSSVMDSITQGACAFWSKPLEENQFKIMWQHLVRKALSETPELPQTLEVKGGKKRGREDVDLPKQPLPKKSRLSWTPDLDKQFLTAVNQLGVNSINATPKNILKLMNFPDLTAGQVASHLQKYRKYLKGEIKKSKFSRLSAFQGHDEIPTQEQHSAFQGHDEISTQEQHLTEIGECDIFFDLSELFPDFVDTL
ncbi:two-component response regulator ARR14-like isoform X2 [Trifolium pratense]|uniref:two-component response regulator ARR14-like isoform X2 n=1 Tax=Trifolium pratense TaxID=57577 RepID=UPI001E69554C|nr:two-component response regulator ARR14-like isoform X2 [Trifolium pratense]